MFVWGDFKANTLVISARMDNARKRINIGAAGVLQAAFLIA